VGYVPPTEDLTPLLADLSRALDAALLIPKMPLPDAVARLRPLHETIHRSFDALLAAIARGTPPPLEPVDALLRRFEDAARAAHRSEFLAPLYPFGLLPNLRARRDDLRYAAAARLRTSPCDCGLLAELHLDRRPSTDRLTKIGSSDDPYDPYDDYTCGHCGARFRCHDASTEQYTAFAWRILREP
jgi:hypothetical protein